MTNVIQLPVPKGRERLSSVLLASLPAGSTMALLSPVTRGPGP